MAKRIGFQSARLLGFSKAIVRVCVLDGRFLELETGGMLAWTLAIIKICGPIRHLLAGYSMLGNMAHV